MCFNKTKESKLLTVKRDITVYKVGCFADKVRFYPYFIANYMYSRKTPMRECVDFDRNSIDIGKAKELEAQINYSRLARNFAKEATSVFF